MLRRPSLLFVATSLTLLYRVALIIVMLVVSVAHFNKYTYWNYFLQTLFYFALWMAMITRYTYLFRALSLFVFPVVFGSVLFVQFFIEVVLKLDGGEQFISATTLDGGTASVGTVHTFDFLVHTCPVLDMFFILLSGYASELRSIVGAAKYELDKRRERWILFLYIVCVPLLPLAIYCTIFNPFKEYTTNAPPAVVFVVALAIYVAVVWWFWEVLTREFIGHFQDEEDGSTTSTLSYISSSSSARLPLPQPQPSREFKIAADYGTWHRRALVSSSSGSSSSE